MAVRLPYSNSGYVPSTALRCARRSLQLRRDERCRCSEQKTRWLKKMMLKAFEHSLTNKNRGLINKNRDFHASDMDKQGMQGPGYNGILLAAT